MFTPLLLSFICLNWFCFSLSLSPENSDLYLLYFADLMCCKDLDSNSFCFVLKMYFSLPQLFVLFDVLSVTVFVIRDRFVKKADLCLNLYPCVIKYYLIMSSHMTIQTDLLCKSATQLHCPMWNHMERCWESHSLPTELPPLSPDANL